MTDTVFSYAVIIIFFGMLIATVLTLVWFIFKIAIRTDDTMSPENSDIPATAELAMAVMDKHQKIKKKKESAYYHHLQLVKDNQQGDWGEDDNVFIVPPQGSWDNVLTSPYVPCPVFIDDNLEWDEMIITKRAAIMGRANEPYKHDVFMFKENCGIFGFITIQFDESIKGERLIITPAKIFSGHDIALMRLQYMSVINGHSMRVSADGTSISIG